MKVWVCRDVARFALMGAYMLYSEKCEPRLVGGRIWSCCRGDHRHEIGGPFCARLFKKWTGLEKHLKPGTKRLMDWTMPLEKQGGEG